MSAGVPLQEGQRAAIARGMKRKHELRGASSGGGMLDDVVTELKAKVAEIEADIAARRDDLKRINEAIVTLEGAGGKNRQPAAGRKRMTRADAAAQLAQVREFLAKHPKGVNLGEIAAALRIDKADRNQLSKSLYNYANRGAISKLGGGLFGPAKELKR